MNLTEIQLRSAVKRIDKPRTVSVLVAARNESAHIRACLEALLQQQFPAGRYEILVGDDHSEDDTAAIVEDIRTGLNNSRPGSTAVYSGKTDPCSRSGDIRPAITYSQSCSEDLCSGSKNIGSGSDSLRSAHPSSGSDGLRSAHPPIRLFRITEKRSALLGKANVLAQLAAEAHGELLLITDADVRVNPFWISSMVRQFSPGVALVSGTVSLFTPSLFSQLQNADWLFYMGKCAGGSEKGNPVTAIGCNMGILASSYHEIGGYEAVPFSVTEDYELFRVIKEAGYECKNILEKDVLAMTFPVHSFRELLRQRKRWLTGSFRKHRPFIVSYNLNGLYFPFLIASGLLIHPLMPILLFSMTWLEKILFLRKIYKKLDLPIPPSITLYPFYIVCCNFLFLFFQLRPGSVTWKGRPYGAN